ANDPIFVDHEESPLTETRVFVVGAIRPGNHTFRFEIGGQREMEIVILSIGCVAPGAIDRNAYELRSELLELRQDLVVKSHLISANGAPVCRIEGQDHWLSAQVLEREF